MASWQEFADAEPELADTARRLLTAQKHMTMATLRRDGAPRISGTEIQFSDGELTLGMMPGSRKAADLRRDPRLAIHSPTVDTPEDDPRRWPGDAKVAGTARELAGDLFRVDITEVVVTRVGDPADHLVIESWHPGRGRETKERR